MVSTAFNSNSPGHLRQGNNRWYDNHSVVSIWRGGREYRFALSPLTVTVLTTISALLLIFMLAMGTYLFLRDDLVSSTLSRHAQMQHAYEDRIAALRAQVDIVTSRQLLDQQAVENRVEKLLARQSALGAQQQQFTRFYKRSGSSTVSKPIIRPNTTGLRLGALVGTSNPFSGTTETTRRIDLAHAGPELFDTVEASLAETERLQLAEIRQLKKAADTKASKLASILAKQGIRFPSENAVGGPLIELKGASKFTDYVSALDASLDTLEKVRKAAKSLPHGSPTPGQKISSRFGGRKDPFTGRRAVHGGLDFKAKYGVPVQATASGKVTKAGRHGGYGKLVEIDHGGGITTRYAHLSRISVKVGQQISRGSRLGKVGSTGRSTGPHLHYEVRRKSRVLNPIHYVRLAKHIAPYL